MNEDEITCLQCSDYINGRCAFLCGAGVLDPDEPFVCIYYSEKERKIDNVYEN